MREAFNVVFVMAVVVGGAGEMQTAFSAPQFLDPGFESYAVANGTHRPQMGANDPPWYFMFPNAFVVDPFFPLRYAGVFDIQAATYAPFEGEQYVSTYAGAAGIGQHLEFDNPGTYRVSAYAASPAGSQTIPGAGTFPLVAGAFRFRVDNAQFGSTHSTPPGATWQRFESLVEIATPGNHWVGVDNTIAAVYFIYYDSFSIQAVPEPSAAVLVIAGIVFGGVRRAAWRTLHG